MVGFLKSRAFAIGVDIEDDSVKLAQLTSNVKGVGLIAGRSKSCPESVKTGSAAWQRWVVEAIGNGQSRISWQKRCSCNTCKRCIYRTCKSRNTIL